MSFMGLSICSGNGVVGTESERYFIHNFSVSIHFSCCRCDFICKKISRTNRQPKNIIVVSVE